MDVKKLIAVVVLYSEAIVICGVYALIFSWLISEVVVLSVVLKKLVAGLIFGAMFALDVKYHMPNKRDAWMGRETEVKDQSVVALYFGVFCASMLTSAIIVQVVSGVVLLEGLIDLIVKALVFSITYFVFLRLMKVPRNG
ncbi:hypothetical protein [Pseudomonas synxantha]|uniref:Uncharacterized protein n=1 Tax=Pseudomonas synxantha TaxID=47883 RepID=A0ACC6JTZ9_9PSED|nr:hypothetical protein [Pseudomonas synxantha]MDR6610058.1 hypothetical protein [Pseudomonas synxantha]